MPADITGTDVIEENRTTGGAGFPLSRRPAVQQRDSGRRNQPHAAEDPSRAAGSDAGAAGHRRPRAARAFRSVLRAGHAESDRAGGHLSAARGPARPFHVQGLRSLPEFRRGVRGGAANDLDAGRFDRAGVDGRRNPRIAADRPPGAGLRSHHPLRLVAGAANPRARGGRARFRQGPGELGRGAAGRCSS